MRSGFAKHIMLRWVIFNLVLAFGSTIVITCLGCVWMDWIGWYLDGVKYRAPYSANDI